MQKAMGMSSDDMNFTEPFLATITARTLIVHGDRDEFFPIAIPVQMYSAIPRSYPWIVPNGGHIPVFGKRASIFQDKALAFLRGEWEKS
jgi:pimeloyl-ACP methyl ester carboxylesterase